MTAADAHTDPSHVREFSKRLAARLRTLRARMGLSQEAMAERAGISTNAYQKFEHAESGRGAPMNPRLKTLIHMAEAFGLEVHELLDLDNQDVEFLPAERGRRQGNQGDQPDFDPTVATWADGTRLADVPDLPAPSDGEDQGHPLAADADSGYGDASAL